MHKVQLWIVKCLNSVLLVLHIAPSASVLHELPQSPLTNKNACHCQLSQNPQSNTFFYLQCLLLRTWTLTSPSLIQVMSAGIWTFFARGEQTKHRPRSGWRWLMARCPPSILLQRFYWAALNRPPATTMEGGFSIQNKIKKCDEISQNNIKTVMKLAV